MQSVDWRGASIGPSPAHSVDFSGGKNLMQNQLDLVIGDEKTILPRDARSGEHLHVWSCWGKNVAQLFREISTERYRMIGLKARANTPRNPRKTLIE
jgi:hypothetical protein